MQGARIWLPIVEEHFVSLDNLITSAQRQRQTASYDCGFFLFAAFKKTKEPLVHVGVTRSGLVGRPRLQILQEHLQTLHNDAGFRWANIGRILGISDRTLRRCYTNMYKRLVAWRRWWSFALTFLHGSYKVPCKLVYDRMKFV